MTAPEDDWLRRELDAMTLDELLMFAANWNRHLRRRGRTGKGQALHHVDGDPRNNSLDNLRVVDIAENRRGKP